MEKINERLNKLKEKVASDEFYNNRGLANEVPFYIFDYAGKDELLIRDFIENDFLPEFKENSRIKMVNIDIYELMLESLKNDKIFDKTFKIEEKRGTKILYEKLKKSFNPSVIVKYIEDKAKDKNVVLISGVGKIYPIVRTHTVLNNLQNIFNQTKVILFFPGEYTSVDLKLFGFKDNNYYRAFKI